MRTTFTLPLVCLALALGATSCGDDDTTTAEPATADGAAGDEATDDGGSGSDPLTESGDGGGTLTFQGTTYDLDGGWCGAAPEQGYQWHGFDDAGQTVDIMVRDGGDPPRYSINMFVDDESWVFRVSGGAESDEAIAAAEAIETTETSIRGEGVTVWPNNTEADEREALAETVDFDYTC